MHRGGSDRMIGGPYIEALNEFWKGDLKAAAEKASLSIVAEPQADLVFPLYRLWIEALAQSESKSALVELLDHLRARGREERDLVVSYTALRGTIHLELDEIGAATLFCNSIRNDNKSNAYAAELALRLSDRAGGAGPSPLDSLREHLQDYICLCTLARSNLMRGQESAARRTVERSDFVFPGCPLPSIFEFHMAIESGEYKQAGVHAAKLVHDYPECGDYSFWAGMAHLRRSNLNEAKFAFEQAARRAGENDPDIALMLGHTLREMARRDHTNPQAAKERAIQALRKSASLLKQHGLPVASAALKIGALEQPENPDESDLSLEEMAPTRIWLVRLSPRRFNELMTNPERDIEFLTRPIGGQARAGDLCFFAGDQESAWKSERRSKSRIWQIGAIYAVMTDPMWHPTTRHEHTLQLVARPPRGIPVDVHYLDRPERATASKKIPKDDASRFATFEVGEGALSLITEAMTRQKQGLITPAGEYEAFELRKPS